VLCVFLFTTPQSHSPLVLSLDILHCLPRAAGVPLESALNLASRMSQTSEWDMSYTCEWDLLHIVSSRVPRMNIYIYIYICIDMCIYICIYIDMCHTSEWDMSFTCEWDLPHIQFESRSAYENIA